MLLVKYLILIVIGERYYSIVSVRCKFIAKRCNKTIIFDDMMLLVEIQGLPSAFLKQSLAKVMLFSLYHKNTAISTSSKNRSSLLR